MHTIIIGVGKDKIILILRKKHCFCGYTKERALQRFLIRFRTRDRECHSTILNSLVSVVSLWWAGGSLTQRPLLNVSVTEAFVFDVGERN